MLKDKGKSAAGVGAATTANPRNHCKASDGGILQPVCDCMPACDGWPKWYAVYTYAKAERLAYGELQRQGYGVFCPVRKVTVRAGRGKRSVERPYFPRYMFMSVDRDIDPSRAWRTPGVAGLVCNNQTLVEIPHTVMHAIMAICDVKSQVRDTPTELRAFAVGDAVTLNSMADAWAGFEAIVSQVIDNKNRIKVEALLFGRLTEIEISRAAANVSSK